MHSIDVYERMTAPVTHVHRRRRTGQLMIWLLLLALVMMPLNATALTTVGEAVSTFAYTQNMHPMGFSERAVPLDNTVAGQGLFNSDPRSGEPQPTRAHTKDSGSSM